MAVEEYMAARLEAQTPAFMQCGQCGLSVLRAAPGQKFCIECAKERRFKSNYNSLRASRAAKRSAVLEPPAVCAQCESQFEKNTSNQKYCSSQCKIISRRKRPVTRACGSCGVMLINLSQRHHFCSHCSKARNQASMRASKERNRQAEYENRKRRDKINHEKLAAYQKARSSNREFRDRVNEARRKRHLDDPRLAINARIRSAVSLCLRGKKAGQKWEVLLGYSSQQLMTHLERQFKRGMTWANRDQWHIDHIVPLSAFNFESPEDDGFKAAWALTNLRPLWKGENLTKLAQRTHLI